ncbi:hypothetical protein Mlaev_02447 [Microbacterium laevaniformans]|jgi:hypothetical protein|uniref:Uncharacterized protein n=2 Tax=Microbacterium laevaniformans TaxID=36807 RepID=A0A150H9T7_9MICO|nr:hypothetical protein Mlaev_02447 [Microbacterium laevaniformans]
MPINTERKEGTMTALTRMAVMLRIYTDDLRERREQGDQMVGWVLVIIAVIVIAGTVVGFMTGWIQDRIAEIVDPF